MTTLPALSMNQPGATLCVTRQPGEPRCEQAMGHCCFGGCVALPCGCCARVMLGHGPKPPPMVKRFETRSFPAPQRLIGQRILIHATKRKPKAPSPYGWIGRFNLGAMSDHPMVHTADCGGACEDDDHRRRECIALTPGWYPAMFEDLGAYDGPGIPLPLGAIVGSAVLGEPLPIVGDRRGVGEVVQHADGRLWHWPDACVRSDPDITDQLPYGDWTPGRWAWPLHDAAPTTERCPNCWGCCAYLNDADSRDCRVCRGAGSCHTIPAKGRQQIGWPCNLETLVTA